jgi:hypothetical protein
LIEKYIVAEMLAFSDRSVQIELTSGGARDDQALPQCRYVEWAGNGRADRIVRGLEITDAIVDTCPT